MRGIPGARGEEGPRGKQGPQGNGSTEVFVLHSFNSTIPQCPQTAHMLWEGFGLTDKAISDSGSCMRRFSEFQKLDNLGSGGDGTRTLWYAASGVDGVQDGRELDVPTARKMAARCSVCEVERSLLTVHSGSTRLPQCPQGWESVWSGFTQVTSNVSTFVVIGTTSRVCLRFGSKLKVKRSLPILRCAWSRSSQRSTCWCDVATPSKS